MSKLYPISNLPTSVFIPTYFEPKRLTTVNGSLTEGEHYTFELDPTTGIRSIIRFKVVPYVDLFKYDFERKSWYHTDQYGGLWRVYKTGDWNPSYGYYMPTVPSTPYPSQTYAYESIDGMFNGEVVSYSDLESDGITVAQFYPIDIKLNTVRAEDKTDYSGGRNIIPVLNNINPTLYKEFYFDKSFNVHTNQDLEGYSPDDIQISITINVDKVNVKCRMDTNTTQLSNYTPVVDYYMVKLTGQNL